ncbi:MAG: TonB-dependent receptor [Mucilaginibacter sp.]|nr:TonB-dependent receptor [Mucilaginibacter sp.]
MVKTFTKHKTTSLMPGRLAKLAVCAGLCLSVQLAWQEAALASTPVKAKTNIAAVQITGTVTDESGATLPGVNVSVKGSKNGTTTNIEGAYRISVEPGTTLIFSMLGFTTQEIKITDQKVVDVKLLQANKQLNEILVIGYGSKNKNTFTGSAVSLNAEDLNKSSQSLAQMLQGRAPGVQVTQNNGTPGASLSIRVRGTNSINADSEPLYVIDGFPVSAGVGFSINPDDVASLTILKDASSTAIYGARGANGVIMITTKSGNKHKSSLSIHSYGGFQRIANRFDLMNGYQNAIRLNGLATAQGNTPPYSAGRLDSLQQGILGTNWQNEVFRTGYVQSHTLSFEGGGPKTNVFSSFDYLKQDGIVIKSGYERIGGRVNINHTINDKLSMSARVFGNYGTQNDLPLAPSTINGFLKQVLKANPASTFDSGISAQRDAQNPLHFLAAEDRSNTAYRTQAYYSLKFEPIKNLVFQTDLGADMTRSEALYFAPSTVVTVSATKGKATITNIDERELIINPTLKYAIKKGGHSLNLLAGFNGQKSTYWENGTIATNFASDELGYNNLSNAGTFQSYSVRAADAKRASWFGRFDYDYKNKYILTGTFRADGSSVFGDQHKWGYFPSAAAAWNFAEEDVIKEKGWFTTGKLRGSYGITGNDRIPTGSSEGTFGANNTTKYTFDGVSTVQGIAIDRLSNPDLKWEETKALDLGLDLGIFNNRVILEVDYYKKNTNDLLLARSISPSTGFTTRLGNAGAVTNQGWEFFLQTTNLRGKGFRWNTTLSYSINNNKVTSLGNNNADIPVGSFKPDGAANFESPFLIRTGAPLGAIYGYVYEGIVQQNDPVLTTTQKNSNPGDPKFKDVNGDGTVNADDRIILGTGVPKAIFGFTNNIVYQGFELDIVVQGQTGGKLLNVQKEDLLNPISNGNGLAQVATDVWSPSNPNGTVPANGFYGTTHGGFVNSRFVESSDFLRVKNVTLGYTLPERITKRFGVSVLHFYVNAQNLLTWTKYSGLDPEIGNIVDGSQQNRNVARALDFNAFPLSKMYLIGAKVTF